MKMIPPYIDTDISNAEKKVFRLLSIDTKLDSWFSFHSLGISKHVSKREGEADFLLVGPEGIFVLEIKGGRIQRKNGLWLFTDRYGRVTQKKESPFTQAKTGLYSIRKNLADKFGQQILHHVFGYGVMFPDITFDIVSPEWDSEIIYDDRDHNRQISDYLLRLAGYWTSNQKKANKLKSEFISEIVDFLRSNFELVHPVSLDLYESEREIFNLTQEQYRALDAMDQNPRLIFSGPAGTGKTLLAVEKARRNNSKGIRTLFICFNRLLGSHLADLIRHEKLEYIRVDSLHQFFYEHIMQKGFGDELKNHNSDKNLFGTIYPDLFCKAWQGETQYEELIIDEGQDILTDKYIAALGHVINGGFDDGKWTLFIDHETQKNMFSPFDQKVFGNLRNLSASYKLTINCRNTRPIALQAEVITGYPLCEVKTAKGLPVKYLWYASSSDQAHQVSEVINNLLKEGVAAEKITILSPLRYQESLAGSGKLRLNADIYRLSPNQNLNSRDLIRCTTIQAYKGLENSVVVLTDIEELSSIESKTVNYVGFTRPRSLLIVAANRKLKGIYETYFYNVVTGKVK